MHEAREQLKNTIASVSVDALQQVYRAHRTDYAQPFELTTRAVGARQLCALALQYLCATDEAGATAAICAARDTLLFSFSPRGFPIQVFCECKSIIGSPSQALNSEATQAEVNTTEKLCVSVCLSSAGAEQLSGANNMTDELSRRKRSFPSHFSYRYSNRSFNQDRLGTTYVPVVETHN